MTESASTASALVQAARELFGRRGFDGASVRAITRRAGVNLGAVTYHFGSKDALYGAAVESAIEPLAAGLGEVAAQPGPALDRLEWCVRLCLDYLWDSPEVPRLMLQRPATDRAVREPAAAAFDRVMSTLARLIAEGQANGAIRPGDPGLLAESALAQPIHFGLRRQPPATRGPDSPSAIEEGADVAEHTVAFVLAGLRAVPDDLGRTGAHGSGPGRPGARRAKRKRRRP